MTDPQVALLMLLLLLIFIMIGFPIAFTLAAMSIFFGYYAMGGHIFNLLVQNTYDIMTNDVLTAVPLFLFMGYIVERANILDRLFFSIQVAAKARPGVDGGGGADHLRHVRHRHRDRGRSRDPDGAAGVPGDAQGRLRHQAVVRRDLRRRLPRHSDPALDHADPLWRYLRRVGRQALRCRLVSRIPARRPLRRLRGRPRGDQPEARAEAAQGRDRLPVPSSASTCCSPRSSRSRS